MSHLSEKQWEGRAGWRWGKEKQQRVRFCGMFTTFTALQLTVFFKTCCMFRLPVRGTTEQETGRNVGIDEEGWEDGWSEPGWTLCV